MAEEKGQTPNYGNWVSSRLLHIFGSLGAVCLVATFFFLPLIAGAALFFAVFAYFAYSRYLFSPPGGDIQAKVRELVLDHLDWQGNGKAIDIGCGNAALAIRLAKKYPNATATGIDYWGGKWEYSKSVCEQNAQIEQVSDRTVFQKASASKLPFDDGYFDGAVSNFVFHEVGDTKDKREVIKEALRVVKKGGKFAFQDLFLEKHSYGDIDKLLAEIRKWGIEEVHFQNTSRAEFIPAALKLQFMLGAIGIIYGTK